MTREQVNKTTKEYLDAVCDFIELHPKLFPVEDMMIYYCRKHDTVNDDYCLEFCTAEPQDK